MIHGPKILFTIPIFGGINVTQTLVTSAVVTMILCISGVLLGRNLKKRPGRAQVLTEKAVTLMTGIVKDAMGEHNAHWTPFIATVFLSSVLGTLLGMTGILRSSTADLSTTMTWAVLVSFICWYQSIKHNGFLAWLKGFTEPMAVMTPMNLVSEIAQPVSLAFRHFGNIAGGGVITILLYWAFSGASAALLGLLGRSSIAVSFVLLVVGAGLLILSGSKNGKRKKLPLLLGILCLALSGLRLIDWLWSLTGRAWPKMDTLPCVLCWFAALVVMVYGIVLLIAHSNRTKTVLGGLLTAAGFLAMCVVCEGPMGVPILSLGIPAVLSLYFDVFSGVIQAFVFSLLTMIYIANNCPAPEEPKSNS